MYLEQDVDKAAEVAPDHAVHLALGALERAGVVGGGGCESTSENVVLRFSSLDCLDRLGTPDGLTG